MKTTLPTRLAQVVAASILIFASVMKFKGDPGAIEIFTKLEMEPGGRYIAAIFEMLAGLLLLSSFAAFGSVLAIGMMAGALIAHATRLGLEVNNDGGALVGQLAIVLLSSLFVAISRRKEIPIIGSSF
ncbi:MAG: hypothetical protein H8E15_03725 [Planctomycetes bacterium]|nr:hypothetical protein [Planctomycetota bacterium]